MTMTRHRLSLPTQDETWASVEDGHEITIEGVGIGQVLARHADTDAMEWLPIETLRNAFVPSQRSGELVQQKRFGTVALYERLSDVGDVVFLEAIDVPGLNAGHQLMVTRGAYEAMERVGR